MGQDYIFIFTITPVQSFISQARKTRDLFAGSQILSELTKEAVKLAKDKDKDAEIIMPSEDLKDLDKAYSISNKFVVIFKNIEEENLELIGRDIEFRTILHWKNEITNKTLNELEKSSEKPILKSCESKNYGEFLRKFNDHITKYFNIYWLFYPLEHNSYENAYKEAEKYLGAIKNVRCFEQFDTEENNRKCSICGERDAIVYKKENDEPLPAFAYNNSLLLQNNYLIEINEGLCGICLVKRFYNKNKAEEFPSTAKIAFLNVENRASNILKNKLEEEYEKKLRQGKFFNEQLYFEENLTKKYFEDYGLDESKLSKAKSKLQEIYQLARKEKIPITRYYALIKFDGDNMGKWLSGEYLKDKSQLKDFHRNLSEKLRNFAEYSRKYLNGELDRIQRGKTVYAGGDDFLGFINLEYLFEVMTELKNKFKEQVSEPLKKEFPIDKELTFSAGIVIAHYKDPLSLVLDWVNKLEEETKNLDEKNAFGIAVLKRSGEIRKAIYKWDKLRYIQEIYKSIVEREEFNSSFITKLEEGFRKIFIDFYLYEERSFKNLSQFLETRKLSTGYRLKNFKFLSNENFIYPEIFRVLKKSKRKNLKNEEIKDFIDKNFKNLISFSNETYNLASFFGILDILKFIEREL